jgi:hypothetical protein
VADRFVRNVADNDWRVNESPCVMVAVGARGGTILYARNDVALGRDAGVEEETDTPSEAYDPFPTWEEGRPASRDDLPGTAS